MAGASVIRGAVLGRDRNSGGGLVLRVRLAAAAVSKQDIACMVLAWLGFGLLLTDLFGDDQ
jgi:hypothetical protein